MVSRPALRRTLRSEGDQGAGTLSFVPEPPPMTPDGAQVRSWCIRNFEGVRRATDEEDRRLRELELAVSDLQAAVLALGELVAADAWDRS